MVTGRAARRLLQEKRGAREACSEGQNLNFSPYLVRRENRGKTVKAADNVLRDRMMGEFGKSVGADRCFLLC